MTFAKKDPVELASFDFLSPEWERCIASWLQECYQLSGSTETLREYERTIYRFFSGVGKSPEDVTREDVQAFISALSQSTRNYGAEPSVSTCNVRLAIIKSLYSYAASYTVADEHGRPQPLLRTAPPTLGMKAKRAPANPRYMTLEDIEKLFSVIDRSSERGARDYALFLFYLTTAQRRSAIANTRHGDIAEAILVDANGTRRNGFVWSFALKGHSQERDLMELQPGVMAAIEHYIELSGRDGLMELGDPIWIPTHMNEVQYDRSQPLSDTSINRRLQIYCRRAGLPKYSLHHLRHSSARLRYQLGEDVLSVSRTLRHRSLSTTTQYLARIASPSDAGGRMLETLFSRF